MKLNVFIIGLLIISLLGCVSKTPKTTNNPPSKIEKNEMESVRKSFTIIVQGMMKSDLKNVYQYLSVTQHNQQSYDEFVADYKVNKTTWQSLFRGAYLKDVAVDENKASVIIVWGTGENALGEFIKEGDTWKLNFIRGTPSVMPPGAGEK